jgi:predicted CXXCH cytochrome family protein
MTTTRRGFSRALLRRFANAGRSAVALLCVVALAALAPPAMAGTNIANTVHNLTPTGRGVFRAAEPAGLCVYCHTPHSAAPQAGLWNREVSGVTYQIYESATLKAQVKQPDGSSRICLSCHDGTLAMGTLKHAEHGVQPKLGLLTGRTVLGTNLTADHPVSFVYDSALAANRGELADPRSLPKTIKLDQNKELQCTSCHDPHEDGRSHFLRTEMRDGALCLDCHSPTGWRGTTHATSSATWRGASGGPWPAGAYLTVAENACENCHRPHAAGHGKALLAQSGEAANCTVCHNGTLAARNIESEFTKLSHHPIENAEWSHTLNEDAKAMPRHVACTDCHNAHASNAATATVPNVSGRLQGARGVNQGGVAVAPARFEYEVCYKCHGMRSAATAGVQRQDNVRNARLQFDPANPSFHPVAAVGKDASIQIIEPGYTATSRLACSSCHNNDAWIAGGKNPAGAHGSIYPPILAREYRTEASVIESPQNYGLCYACHPRTALMFDIPGKFPHAKHLNKQASCAACHDAHGSRQYPHLINFMLFDQNGIAVATRSAVQKRLAFIQQGRGGQCYLSCHGVNHEPLSYP